MAGGGVVVVVAVWVAAVVGAADPREQRGLGGGERHGVGAEDAQHLVGDLIEVVVGQTHHHAALSRLQTEYTATRKIRRTNKIIFEKNL